MEFILNEQGFVSQVVIGEERILVDDLCIEYEEQEPRKLFILLLPELLRSYREQLREEHLKVINKELARFGLDEVNNFEELTFLVKKFDINFSYLIIQWTDYVKKTIKLPYDNNFLFVSEILEYVFKLFKQQVEKDYEIKFKENNNFFILINTNDLRNIKNARKLKVAIQRYSLKFEHYDLIFLPDDFLISISSKDIADVDLSNSFKYFERPNFVLNIFKTLGIEHPSLEKMFSNYNLPVFFTDVFNITLKT